MTTTDFELARTSIHTFTIIYASNTAVLDCAGRPACNTCVFGTKQRLNGECPIRDRDRLTPNQLTILKTNYPEMFV